jgi:hypothetical protein
MRAWSGVAISDDGTSIAGFGLLWVDISTPHLTAAPRGQSRVGSDAGRLVRCFCVVGWA